MPISEEAFVIHDGGTDLPSHAVELIREGLLRCPAARPYRSSSSWAIQSARQITTVPPRFRASAEGVLDVTPGRDILHIDVKSGDTCYKCWLKIPHAIANHNQIKDTLAKELSREGKKLRERRKNEVELERAEARMRERNKTASVSVIPPILAAIEPEEPGLIRKRISAVSLIKVNKNCRLLFLGALKLRHRQLRRPLTAGETMGLIREIFEFRGKAFDEKGQPTDRGLGMILWSMVKAGYISCKGNVSDPLSRSYWPKDTPEFLPDPDVITLPPEPMPELRTGAMKEAPSQEGSIEERLAHLEKRVAVLEKGNRLARLLTKLIAELSAPDPQEDEV